MIHIKDNNFIVKSRICKGLYDAFKIVLKANKTTAQTVIENFVKDYLLNNMEVFKNNKKK